MTAKGSAQISVRPQFNVGLEVDTIDVGESKPDERNLEPGQGINGAKYDISLYSAVALILNAKGLYQENGGLNYGLYATAGNAFENWDSEPTNGELMGKVSNPVLIQKADESVKAPNSGDSSERGLFGPKSLTCPKEDKKCPDVKCDVDLCATGDYGCSEP
jgi:hypothetical protein